MEIRSLCPLPTASLVFRPREGRHAIAVICKITYRLEPGVSTLAAEQEPIQVEEQHFEGDPKQSLERPTDIVPGKPQVDVVVVGSAHAPHGKPVFSLVARVVVGELDKSIEVHGPRTLGPGGVDESTRFTEVKLRYERAAGGPSTWNPVGMRLDDAKAARAPTPAALARGFFRGGAAPARPARRVRPHRLLLAHSPGKTRRPRRPFLRQGARPDDARRRFRRHVFPGGAARSTDRRAPARRLDRPREPRPGAPGPRHAPAGALAARVHRPRGTNRDAARAPGRYALDRHRPGHLHRDLPRPGGARAARSGRRRLRRARGAGQTPRLGRHPAHDPRNAPRAGRPLR